MSISSRGDVKGLAFSTMLLLAVAAGCSIPGVAGDSSTPPSPAPASTVPASAVPGAPVWGQILDAEGRPAANVKVSAYAERSNPLIGNAGAGLVGTYAGGLIGNAGSGLAGNAGATYRTLAGRVVQAGISVNTDANGFFVLSPQASGTYNIEAVQDDKTKAWKGSLAYGGAGTSLRVDDLRLGPVGSIRGRVRGSDPAVTNFQNTQVYIPGSGYVAVTGADGAYTVPNVAAGAFRLHAFNMYLGDGELPDAERPDLINVVGNQVAEAPDLVMQLRYPEIERVTISGSSRQTDNGGVGTALEIHGRNFGQTRGAPLEVTFAGVGASGAKAASDELITAIIPVGAVNGDLDLKVGFLKTKKPVPFRIIKDLVFPCGSLDIDPAATHDLQVVAEAKDTAGVVLPPYDVPGETALYGANLAWRSNSALALVSQFGILTPVSTGTVTVSVSAGSNLIVSCDVGIGVPRGSAGTTKAPELSSVSPLDGGVGTKLRIKGKDFGSPGSSVTVQFAGNAKAFGNVIDSDTVEVAVPQGAGTGPLSVSAGTSSPSNTLAFTVISALSAPSGTMSIAVGGTQQAAVAGTDTAGEAVAAPSLEYQSANPAIARVSPAGLVTGVAAGDTRVYAVSGTVQTAISVHVYQILGVALSSLQFTLNALPAEGEADPRFKTQATVSASVLSTDGASRPVRWSVSDTGRIRILGADAKEATVGTVPGAPEGFAVLTATSVDDPAMSASATVSVTIQSRLEIGVQ